MLKATKMLQARFSADEIKRFDDWRRAQPNIPNIRDAVRTLVFRGLSSYEEERRATGRPAKK